VVLPPSQGISDAWPESQQLVALPQGSQITISSPWQATTIAFNLLEVIAIAYAKTSKSTLARSWNDSLLQWALDSCTRLWTLCNCWSKGKEQASSTLKIVYIRSLEAVSIRQIPGSEDSHLASENAAVALSHGLSNILVSTCGTTPDEAIQSKLTWSLVRLRQLLGQEHDGSLQLARHLSGPRSIVEEILKPAIIHICQNPLGISKLRKDLQVSLRI
jgi:serine/threonine-protein kinase ATR